MIRQILVFALTSAILGGCWSEPAPPPPPKPYPDRPRPVVEDPVNWITPDPECRGEMRRGEWLVCDNKNLRYLHRELANQWAAARQGAERGALRVMRQQQEALLSERNRCEDAACVAIAYRRYVAGYSPQPRPTWTPRPRPPVKYVKPRRRHQGDWRDEYPRPSRRGTESCSSELGGSGSAYLVKQCRVVNGQWDRSCTAETSCEDLRYKISRGCSDDPYSPGFCRRR